MTGLPQAGLQEPPAGPPRGAARGRGLQGFQEASRKPKSPDLRFGRVSKLQGPDPANDRGFGVCPSRGKSMYIVYIWPTGLCLPMYGKSPERLYTSTLHRLLSPSMGVKADVYLQCLTTLVMGGNGLSRPRGNSGFN